MCRLLLKKLSLTILVVLVALLPTPTLAEDLENMGYQAKRSYEDGNYNDALKTFEKGSTPENQDYRFLMGKGSSEYRLKKYDQAVKSFLDAAKLTKNKSKQSQAMYNAGNSLVQQNQLETAVQTYQKALELTPEDEEIKNNLDYVKKILKKKEEEQKKEKSKDKSQEEKQKDQEQKQQEEEKKDKSEQKDSSEQQNQDQNKDNQSEQSQENDQEEKKDQQQGSNEKENEKKDSESNDSVQGDKKKEKDGTQDEQFSENQNGSDEKKQDEQSNSEEYQGSAEAVLDSVGEDRGALKQYRARKAYDAVRRGKISVPEQDW